MNGFGKLIFWDFKRASWQYDVVVAVILVFIFAVPRELFSDQPTAARIMMLPDQAYWLEAGLLEDIATERRVGAATELVQKRFKSRAVVQHIEAIYEEDKLAGFLASTKP